MKKLVIALLVLVMLTACIGPAMAVQYYSSKFTAGTDGWYARGAQAVYRTTEGTLRTEGRTSDWHSPGRDFVLVDGCLYKLSVEVYQNEVDSARSEKTKPTTPTQPPSTPARSTSAPFSVTFPPVPSSVIKVMSRRSAALIPVPAAIEPRIFFASPRRPLTTCGVDMTAESEKAIVL